MLTFCHGVAFEAHPSTFKSLWTPLSNMNLHTNQRLMNMNEKGMEMEFLCFSDMVASCISYYLLFELIHEVASWIDIRMVEPPYPIL